jgi:hypothetical protein
MPGLSSSMHPGGLHDQRRLFESIEFDEDGRYLIMHQKGAGKYYKMNVLFIALFFGMSWWTYKTNSTVFWNDRLAKVYLAIVGSSMIGLWLFANKHIQALYLLKG